MSKGIIVLIILLLFVSVVLATLTYLYRQKAPQVSAPQEQSQISAPPSTSECALVLSPESLTVTPGIQSQLDVTIGSDGDYPTEVQVELSYDPVLLSNVRVVPGSFIDNPTILFNNVDQSTGRISYAMATPPNQQPQRREGTIASIFFTTQFTLQSIQTTIGFLPKTAVYSFNQKSTIKEMLGAKVLVSRPLNTASQSSQLIFPSLPKIQPNPALPVK